MARYGGGPALLPVERAAQARVVRRR